MWNIGEIENRGQFHLYFRTAFLQADPKSPQKTDSLTVFFALLGSAHVKAWHKHVGEIDPRLPEKQEPAVHVLICKMNITNTRVVCVKG